jgi:hypothetical protein
MWVLDRGSTTDQGPCGDFIADSMHDSNRWPTKLTKILLTPRKLAWVLVIAGIAYFIYVSPKNPVEFYDAAARDAAALRRYEIEEYKRIDPSRAASVQKLEDISSCCQRMGRIALLYDLAHNPKQVNSNKSSIIDGSYSHERTDTILRADNESYRELARQLEKCRKEFRSDALRRRDAPGRAAPVVSVTTKEDWAVDAAFLRMEYEGSLFRQLQARVFWRDVR